MADADLHELIQGAQPDSLGRDLMGMRWTPKPQLPANSNRQSPVDTSPKRRRWFRRSD